MAITLNAAYEVKNLMTPWVFFSTYDNKQADDKDNNMKDFKYNRPVGLDENGKEATDMHGNPVVDWSDNGVVWGLGVNFDNFGKGWTPYVALVSSSGKFQKALTSDASDTKTEMDVKIGVLGEL
jgi:hypothetical protein